MGQATTEQTETRFPEAILTARGNVEQRILQDAGARHHYNVENTHSLKQGADWTPSSPRQPKRSQRRRRSERRRRHYVWVTERRASGRLATASSWLSAPSPSLSQRSSLSSSFSPSSSSRHTRSWKKQVVPAGIGRLPHSRIGAPLPLPASIDSFFPPATEAMGSTRTASRAGHGPSRYGNDVHCSAVAQRNKACIPSRQARLVEDTKRPT